MKRKISAGILVLAMTAGVLVGCGKKEVDYSLEGDTELNSESNMNSSNALAKFREMENRIEEWQVIDKNGKEVTLKIDAEIVVPDLDDMHAIEVERVNMDAAFCESVIRSVFEDADIYYHEEEHWTKEEVKKFLPDDAEMLANAPDTHTVAEEFESVTHYAAYRNEILYEIYMEGDRITIQPNWLDEVKLVPEQFRDYNTVYTWGVAEEDASNSCKYTIEEARVMADKFMKDIGLGGMEGDGGHPALWRATNEEDLDPEKEEGFEYACYGYFFDYGATIDDGTDAENARSRQYNTMWTDGLPVMDYDGEGGGISILVTDEGIQSIGITKPEIVRHMSGPVEFLSLDSVMEIMKNDVASHSEEYDIGSDKTYNRLELLYMIVKDEAQENIYSYIPVWCLSRKDEFYDSPYDPLYLYHPTFVNAIDGTVLFTPKDGSNEEE